jgi:uridine phosphorylase
VLLCGDPERTTRLALETPGICCEKTLSTKRGLMSYLIRTSGGGRMIAATSGMGAPSLSIAVNELVSAGAQLILRIGTCGSIREEVKIGHVVITRAALCRQGAAQDIAPKEYPAAADPFLTVALVQAANDTQVCAHLGITASVDTFYEGQERTASSANPHLLRKLQGITEEYRRLNLLSYEMETGTLFKMAGVYGFAAGSVCAVVAERTSCEDVARERIRAAERNAVQVALRAMEILDGSV